MAGEFKVISISYKKAPLEVREHISLNEGEIKALYLKLSDVLGLQEVLIVSTCNRTEIYYVSSRILQEEILALLGMAKGICPLRLKEYAVYIEEPGKAISYLFEVATGLHSQVIGDLQIPNQIKKSYQWCSDANMAGAFMHRLMHTVFFVNKRVFQETSFRDGAASTSYAAVETIETFLPLLPNPQILILGLGEMGIDVVDTLVDKGYEGFTISNRTIAKAEELAQNLNCKVLPFENISKDLQNYDIVISSVQAPEAIITAESYGENAQAKIRYLIDLSVPRSIHPDTDKVSGLVVYDLDEIQTKANLALERRKEAIPAVRSIIAESVQGVLDWVSQMSVSPTIQKLKSALDQIRKEEMAKYTKGLSDQELKKVNKITESMMQKVMKIPVLQLKAACKRGEAEELIDVLTDLFDLEKVEASAKS